MHVTLPDVLGGTARTITFDVIVDDPSPTVLRVSAQGTVSATDGRRADRRPDAVRSGRPDHDAGDPLLRRARGLLSGRLVVDADGSGACRPATLWRTRSR